MAIGTIYGTVGALAAELLVFLPLLLMGGLLFDTGSGGAGDGSGVDGNDTLTGSTADDLLEGGPGIDIADGGAGHDKLNGGAGHAELAGGLGADEYQLHVHPDGTTDVVHRLDIVSGVDRIEIHLPDDPPSGMYR